MLHSTRCNTAARRLSPDRAPDWRDHAACRDVDPELFFGPQDSPVDTAPLRWELVAIATCVSCPVQATCLAWALDAGQVQWGVLGGLRAADRAALHGTSREVAA